MDLLTQLAAVTRLALELWNHKEKGKYFEQFIEIERSIHYEWSKPEDRRDHAILDHAEFELLLLTRKVVETSSTPSRPDA